MLFRSNHVWQVMPTSEKLIGGMIFVNLVVFGLWRVRNLKPFMMQYFAANPALRKNCLPMLFCAFSHVGPLHLMANMYALMSFGPRLVDQLSKEHFLGVYLTAAVVSSFCQYVYQVNIYHMLLVVSFFKKRSGLTRQRRSIEFVKALLNIYQLFFCRSSYH